VECFVKKQRDSEHGLELMRKLVITVEEADLPRVPEPAQCVQGLLRLCLGAATAPGPRAGSVVIIRG
jgi:hypothetical protein